MTSDTSARRGDIEPVPSKDRREGQVTASDTVRNHPLLCGSRNPPTRVSLRLVALLEVVTVL